MRRVVSSLLFLALVPVSALAKSAQDSWDNLKQLAPGDGIRIVLNDMKSYAGQFQSVSDDAIVVRLTSGDQTLSRESVLRVSTKGQSHRGRNALIGLGVGVATMVVADAEVCQHCGGDVWVGDATEIGLVGAGVGALIPTGRWHDVYRAR